MYRILAFLIVLMTPAIAWAAENATVASRLMESGVEILASVLFLVLMLAVRKGVKLVEEKFGVDISDVEEKMLLGWVEKGINYAEEQGSKLAKAQGKKLGGPDKMELAVGFVLDLAEQQGWDDLAKDKLTRLVESKLGEKR